MNRRIFWQVPECVKFRAVFEDAETIVGVNEAGEHRLFRKDTGRIVFSEREALEISLAALVEKDWAASLSPSAAAAEINFEAAIV
jgi:hypothetical protein